MWIPRPVKMTVCGLQSRFYRQRSWYAGAFRSNSPLLQRVQPFRSHSQRGLVAAQAARQLRSFSRPSQCRARTQAKVRTRIQSFCCPFSRSTSTGSSRAFRQLAKPACCKSTHAARTGATSSRRAQFTSCSSQRRGSSNITRRRIGKIPRMATAVRRSETSSRSSATSSSATHSSLPTTSSSATRTGRSGRSRRALANAEPEGLLATRLTTRPMDRSWVSDHHASTAGQTSTPPLRTGAGVLLQERQ